MIYRKRDTEMIRVKRIASLWNLVGLSALKTRPKCNCIYEYQNAFNGIISSIKSDSSLTRTYASYTFDSMSDWFEPN